MTSAVIVQARMASTRLPEKVMKLLAGQTVLAHVLTRCMAIPGIDVVCCATVDDESCDSIAAEAERLGTVVYRGSETDVLGRYLEAAQMLGADEVMRVTSDCPVVDPIVAGAVVALRRRENVGYATNNMPPSWPQGVDCEVLTMDALRHCARMASDAGDREHLTRLIRNDDGYPKASLLGPAAGWDALRWTLDTPQDFQFFQALFSLLPPSKIAGIVEIGSVLAAHPEIIALNAQEERHHGLRRQAPTASYLDFMPAIGPFGVTSVSA